MFLPTKFCVQTGITARRLHNVHIKVKLNCRSSKNSSKKSKGGENQAKRGQHADDAGAPSAKTFLRLMAKEKLN
jgi:hypothetical protein